MKVHLTNVDNPKRASFVMVNPELLEECRKRIPGRQYEHAPASKSSCQNVVFSIDL